MASVEASVEGCRQRFGTRRWRIDKKRRLGAAHRDEELEMSRL
jgi:hypothetical protein